MLISLLLFYITYVLTNDSNMEKINMADTVSSAAFHIHSCVGTL